MANVDVRPPCLSEEPVAISDADYPKILWVNFASIRDGDK
jgi:hypothetical protein